ncbi:MAG TPA: LarC family nickel insertion protein, partial [Acidobacteriota bacterium]|nr:LarC family nickel insertion protein [Acidobacteriota bacterium]
MSTILIFDPFSGISGDMTVGALLDVGLPLQHLQESLASLKLEGLSLAVDQVTRAGLRGKKFRVIAPEQKGHRHLSHIRKLIDSGNLGAQAQQCAHAIFRKLAEAEAEVHGTTVGKVHFHEVGALDSIADIVGASVGFGYFGVEEFFTGPINVGSGTIRCEHGVLPVPPPATALLLKNFDTFPGMVAGEM